jgi:hypothetical protein
MTSVADVQSSSTHPTDTWRVIGRWMASVLGFPIGGLVAITTVGAVDSTSTALAAGAITGAILGAAQATASTALALRTWVVATTIGLSTGLAVGATVVDFDTSVSALAIQGAVTGLSVGLAQAIALHRRHAAGLAFAWIPFLGVCWALGWTITAAAGVDVERQYTVFGATGAIVVTALTCWLPLALRRR